MKGESPHHKGKTYLMTGWLEVLLCRFVLEVWLLLFLRLLQNTDLLCITEKVIIENNREMPSDWNGWQKTILQWYQMIFTLCTKYQNDTNFQDFFTIASTKIQCLQPSYTLCRKNMQTLKICRKDIIYIRCLDIQILVFNHFRAGTLTLVFHLIFVRTNLVSTFSET